MTNIAMHLLVPKLLKSKEEGRSFMEMLLRHFPSHIPERYGSEEPLRKKFSTTNLDKVLDEWGHFCFTAERKSPRLWFNVWFAFEAVPVPVHTSIHIRIEAEYFAVLSAAKQFLLAATVHFGADLAVAHVLTDSEFEERLHRLRLEPGSNVDYILQRVAKLGVAETLDGMTVTQFKPNVLKRGLPDLCWLTVFGAPYVELFGRDRLFSVPANEVYELSNGSVLVKLTQGITPDRASWAAFQDARRICKQHLNSSAFATNALDSAAHPRNMPKFRFPLEMYKSQSTS